MTTTKIEWTRGDDGTPGVTWNPTTGCDRISPGCDHCYALTMAKRLKGMGQAKYQNDGDPRTSGPGFGLTVHEDTLDAPLRWAKPSRVFVNSMSDLFHARVPAAFIVQVWRTMQATPQHTYQVLTKRPERLARVLDHVHQALELAEPLANVWLGTSIESDDYARRADALRRAPAAVRFISAEPLIGPLPSLDLTGIDWLIVGGESGAGARPLELDWVRELLAETDVTGTAPFVKQLGSVWARDHYVGGKSVAAHKDTKGGKPEYWPADLRVRDYPRSAAGVTS
jgi:protein gp37